MNKILIATIISTLLFIIVTFTPLFNYIKNLLTNLTGHKLDNNIYIVILIQAIIFGILIYAILSSLKEEKEEPESKDKLDAFDVGGSLRCK